MRVSWPQPVRVFRCDIMERPQEEITAIVTEGEVRVALKPCGTATPRLRP